MSLLSDSSEEERFQRMEMPTGLALLRLLLLKKYAELFPSGLAGEGWRQVEATGLQPQVGLFVSFLLLFFSAEPRQDSSTWDEQSNADLREDNFR